VSEKEVGVRRAFDKFRAVFWALAAGVVGLYLYGLFLGIYSPLQLGLLSVVCLVLLVMFAMHELALRRERRSHPPKEFDHTDRERRGW
jgi:TRAP-type C4-dicarboxylate transport system permease large subunit